MKKKVLISIIVLIIGIILAHNPLKAATVKPTPYEYGSYDDAINIVKETMLSYYIRGPQIQYNYAKTTYPIGSPEEATIQDNNYSVCAAYTYSVYSEAFGIKYNKGISEFPRYNYNISDVAREYYENKNNAFDGNFLIYYENDANKIKYIYGDQTTNYSTDDFEMLVNQIKPGDLFVYTGHALIAYDVEINPKTGKKDVLILNSTNEEFIKTRIDGTSRLTYNMFPSPNNSSGILDKINEGTIQFFWLSDSSYFMNKTEKTLDCQKEECAVIRIFYNNNGKAAFNYNINESQYKVGKLRTEYPGLLIEKTVGVGDNNSVYLNNELTYTIKITNQSTIQPKKSKDYTIPFYINEEISTLVEYKSSNNNGTFNNGKITWKINSLKKDESIELKYTVKIKNKLENVSKTINSTGTFYSQNNSSAKISTGMVKNKIIPTFINLNKTYKECYTMHSNNYTGLKLINEIYKCSTNRDFKFESINFEDIFSTTIGNTPKSQSKIVKNPNASTDSNTFYNMILNNYFNATILSDGKYYLPRMENSPRARTINYMDFKNGDILIYSIEDSLYTTESGIYAYIFIDGKFIGKNLGNNTGKETRINYEYDYYKDNKKTSSKNCQTYGLSVSADCNYTHNLYQGYTKLNANNKEEIMNFVNYQALMDKNYYVILRPEQVIQEESKISITSNPKKLTYIQSKEELSIGDGQLTIYYNDGSSKKLNLNHPEIKISNFNNSKLGKVKVTIEYKSKKTTLEVEIIPKQISSINIEKNPNKTTYIQNFEDLNLTGGQLLITYNDNTKEIIDMNSQDITIKGFNNSKLGNNIITLTYKNFKVEFNVKIVEKQIKKIELSKLPNKTTYLQNKEKLDLTGGEIKIIYNDNTQSILEMNNQEIKITGFNNSILGKQKLNLLYQENIINFYIEIVNKEINKIKIKNYPIKSKYILNKENLDLKGGTLEVIYNDKTTEIIELTNKNIQIENFNNSILGKQTITIKYKNAKTTLDIEIIENSIKEVLIISLPKFNGKIENFNDLNFSYGKIKVIYLDGTDNVIKMSNENIKLIDIDNSVEGKSIITLEYLNYLFSFELNYENQDKTIFDFEYKLYLIIGLILFTLGISTYFVHLKKIK